MSTMLRDSHTASSNFRLNSQVWDGTPKPGFLYYIRFVRANAGASGNDWAKGIGILAKQIDRPKVNFDTEVLNQYNKKRIVQKRVEYEPVSFTFHDTVDNKAFHMFEDYFRFYYGDPRNSSATDWSWDIMSNTMNPGQAGAWGFIPPVGNTNLAYFFSHIEFYYIYGGYYSRYDIINPKIKSFSPSDMSMDSSEGASIQMTFEFEGLIYQGNNLSLSGQAGLLQEMGLSASSFYEPRTASGSAVIGSGANYSKQGATPFYNSAELFALASADSSASVNAVNRSSTLVDSNLSFNSIFTGLITMQSQPQTTVVTGDPTIGDNLAKRLVKGMK